MTAVLENVSLGNLLFAIAAGFLLLMIILQACLNRSVWWVYQWSLPVVLVLWVLFDRGVIR